MVYKIDFSKVRTIEDIKVILESLYIRYDDNLFSDIESIKYLLKESIN